MFLSYVSMQIVIPNSEESLTKSFNFFYKSSLYIFCCIMHAFVNVFILLYGNIAPDKAVKKKQQKKKQKKTKH